jgi:hypothetical protein
MSTRPSVIGFVLGSLLALGASAQPEPNLICEKPTFDFGTLINTSVVTHTFLLRNVGGATAVITRVHSTCGCTTVTPPRTQIPPGETEPVTARFELHDRFGEQGRPLYIGWNNASNYPLRLTFTGIAVPPLRTQPPTIVFSGSSGSTSRTARIRNPYTNRTFRVTGSICDSTRFTTRIEATTPGQEYILHVYDTQPAAVGATSALVTVTSDDPRYSAISVPVRKGRSTRNGGSLPFGFRTRAPVADGDAGERGAHRHGAGEAGHGTVTTDPDFISFGVVGATGSVSRAVRVSVATGSQPFRVAAATVPDSSFTARVETNLEGRVYRVQVSSAGPRKPGAVSTVVTLKTDLPDAGEIDIPVYMRVREGTAPVSSHQ